MLLPDDVELVHRDRELPGLATVLDPEAIIDGLRGLGARSARATYVRYKPGGSATVAYRIDVDGKEIDAYAKAFRHGDESKCSKVVDKARPLSTGCPGAVLLHNGTVAVALFPNDEDLSGLECLGSPADRRSLLRSLLPDERGIRGAGFERLRYKPGRRYVARVTLKGSPRAVLKLYEQQEYDRAFRSVRTLESRGGVTLPALLGACERRHALAFEWLSGTTLERALRRGTQGAVQEVGTALGALHGGTFAGPGALGHSDETNEVRKAAGALGAILPGQRDVVEEIASLILDGLTEVPPEPTVVHGDFSADQVLVSESGMSFIDLDWVAIGHPAADLGSFGAALWRDAILGTISSHEAEARFGELVSGYHRSTRRVFGSELHAYLAARMMRLAPEPFRLRDAQWRAKTSETLLCARRILVSKDPITC